MGESGRIVDVDYVIMCFTQGRGRHGTTDIRVNQLEWDPGTFRRRSDEALLVFGQYAH
jgi:hypothetical protein